MMFISHAQNFEDVMLWRALRNIPDGFYIDVGAADPKENSVTRAFYEHGWRGVNIEPEPGYAAALRESRPCDINLEVAAGAVPGTALLHCISGTGLSTFDRAIAEQHTSAGFPPALAVDVEVTTVTQICRAHAPPAIHFLKIDVEGSERDVLLGTDLRAFRPWIILVEATKPFSPEIVSGTFEHLVHEADYQSCWFDGLNTFYIAAEREEHLRGAFQAPPNFFDGFVMGNYLAQASRADAAEQRAQAAEARVKQLEMQLSEITQRWG